MTSDTTLMRREIDEIPHAVDRLLSLGGKDIQAAAEAARALAPGADVYALEAEWQAFAAKSPPRAPDAAFLGWVRKRGAGL